MRSKKKKSKTKKNTKKPAPPKTHHEIHSNPTTATTSRRLPTEQFPRVSPYSPASIDPGFVEIGFVQLSLSVLVERYMRQGCLVLAVGRVRSEERKRKEKNTKSHQNTLPGTKYIHSSPATATTSRRRAVKHAPLVSPCSHSSSVDPGFVDIGLACIHTYVYTRTAAAAAAPPVCALVLYTISGQRSFVFLCCDTRIISGFGVVLWCLTLSFP